MSARAPRVSVCLPVRNGADHLAASITSVLTQTFGDLRLIVVDNWSTDATAEIVHGFTDSRIVYHRNSTDIGLVANHNRGLELADGEFVCVWHDDDVMLPANLEAKVRVLDANPTVGYVHSNLWMIDAAGTLLGQHWFEDSRQDYVRSGLDVFRRFLAGLHWGALVFMGAAVARRECYVGLGRFRAELPNCCDSEMFLRMALFHDVACLGAALVQYRLHPGSVSTANQGAAFVREHYEAARLIFDRYRDRIPDVQILEGETRQRFILHAILRAASAARRGDLRLGWDYLRLARDFPPISGAPSVWSLALRLAATKLGIRQDDGVRKPPMR